MEKKKKQPTDNRVGGNFLNEKINLKKHEKANLRKHPVTK